jgi:hypothetical protein
MPADASAHAAQHRQLESLAEVVMKRFGWDRWPDRDARERIGVWGGGLLHNPRLPPRVRYFGALARLQSLWFASIDAALRRAPLHARAQAALADHPDFEHYAAMAIRASGNRWCVAEEIHWAYGGAAGLFPNDFRWFPAGPERDAWWDHLAHSGMSSDAGLLDLAAPRAPWTQVEMHTPTELLAMARALLVSPCIRYRRDWHPLVDGDRLQRLLCLRVQGQTIAGWIDRVENNASTEATLTLRDFGIGVDRELGLILRLAAPGLRDLFGGPEAMVDYLASRCGGVRVSTHHFQPDTEPGVLLPRHLAMQWLTRWIPDPRYTGWKEKGGPF